MTEGVEMKHKGIEGVAVVTLESFNKLHKQKGWMLVKPSKVVEKKAPSKKAESTDE